MDRNLPPFDDIKQETGDYSHVLNQVYYIHENARLRTIIIMEIRILDKIDLKQEELVALEEDPSIM